jgi:cellulose biosynthesis protein BcsQ
MKVLALICQKGGTAKTTTAINLAVEAMAYGLEVAVIDIDPSARRKKRARIHLRLTSRADNVPTFQRHNAVTPCR